MVGTKNPTYFAEIVLNLITRRNTYNPFEQIQVSNSPQDLETVKDSATANPFVSNGSAAQV